MSENYFDVVVLGRSLGAWVAATLLARRDFRVLLLGQGGRPSEYQYDDLVFCRSAFAPLFSSSPVFRRILAELAQTQSFRRRARPFDPTVQFLSPKRRFEVPSDPSRLARELEREFPDTRRLLDEVAGELSQANAGFDAAFDTDLVWPPGTFWERRAAVRAATPLMSLSAENPSDLLATLAPAHPYRRIFATLCSFASDADFPPTGPSAARSRLHALWTRGLLDLPGGDRQLEEFFIERFVAHGGTCRLAERGTAVRMPLGRDHGIVQIDGDGEPTACGFLVFDGTGEELARLAQGEGILGRAEREWPLLSTGRERFVVNLLVRTEGVPRLLGGQSFLLAGDDPTPSATRPDIHITRLRAPLVAADSGAPERWGRGSITRLIAELLLPRDAKAQLQLARSYVVDMVASHFPFLPRHCVAVDSPHDGLPLWLYERGERREVDRRELRSASYAPEPMLAMIRTDATDFLGLSAEPLRGPLPRSFLVGRSVLPALGQEGQLLAGCGAARIITKSDRRKEKIRRAMWSKGEIG